MKTLCMDTTHKYLVIGLYEDNQCVAKVNEMAWKKQSERFFPELMECLKKANWNSDDINQVVITEGPGSYTGERIAMCIAKVLCTSKNLPLYTISTFQLYAGDLENVEVIMDARSQRAYCGICNKGQLISETIKTLSEVQVDLESGLHLIGDTDLINLAVEDIDFAENFMKVKQHWKKVDNIHTLTPHYLKSQEELVKGC